ncbi:MAG: hypothetical protein ACI9DH_000860 [Halioglobus sp.]|jgi:hypothetical protein
MKSVPIINLRSQFGTLAIILMLMQDLESLLFLLVVRAECLTHLIQVVAIVIFESTRNKRFVNVHSFAYVFVNVT